MENAGKIISKTFSMCLYRNLEINKGYYFGYSSLYGALTNEIKKLLLDSKLVNTSNKKRDDFDEFCEVFTLIKLLLI